MVEGYLRQNALAHLALDGRASAASADANVRLWLEPPRGQTVLRGNGGARAFASAVHKLCGVSLPAKPNTVAGESELQLLWLGPDEWLLVCEEARQVELLQDLEAALEGQHALLTDVSHSRCILGLEGVNARHVLCKGASLDLHPTAFAPGSCAQTALARAHMLLHQLSDMPSYRVYVHRSFTDYVFRWFEDASAEYGLAIGRP